MAQLSCDTNFIWFREDFVTTGRLLGGERWSARSFEFAREDVLNRRRAAFDNRSFETHSFFGPQFGARCRMQGTASRRLIWVPIVHTQEDLGSLKESVRRLHVRRVGRGQWQRGQQMIAAMWTKIEQEIERLDLDYPRVRLYQDGLACCGHEEEIVRDLAGVGSRNHQLLLKLMARGARIMGTESPELLLEEYELSRHAILAAGGSTGITPEQREASDRILKKRDAYVATRIAESLLAGETGVAFLGLLHSLAGRLPGDVEVTRLDLAPQAVVKNSGRVELS